MSGSKPAVRLTIFIGAAFEFFVAIDTPERLSFKSQTKIRMRRAPYEVHGCAADRTGKPII
jgi:hypothetical protein